MLRSVRRHTADRANRRSGATSESERKHNEGADHRHSLQIAEVLDNEHARRPQLIAVPRFWSRFVSWIDADAADADCLHALLSEMVRGFTRDARPPSQVVEALRRQRPLAPHVVSKRTTSPGPTGTPCSSRERTSPNPMLQPAGSNGAVSSETFVYPELLSQAAQAVIRLRRPEGTDRAVISRPQATTRSMPPARAPR